MGLEPVFLEYIDECVAETLGALQGRRMLELGDQTIASDSIPESTGKAYYENRGHWRYQCNNYYSHEFFVLLSELNNYALVSSKVIWGLRCVCLRKTEDVAFTENREALLAAIARRGVASSITASTTTR
jgi:hypothetical protein